MRYKLLGGSGIRVSEICLGTMTFGNKRGWGADKCESRAVFDAFVAAGGNFFDTANVYQSGDSEEYLGEFIAAERHRHVVATKFALADPSDPDPNIRGNSRKALLQGVEGSLRRLRTDYIDLLWVHAWDGRTDCHDVLGALDGLIRQGKVLAIGFSDTPAWVCARLQTIAELRGLTKLSAAQFTYSLIERSVERELMPMATDLDMLVTVWGALAAGLLTGKYGRDHRSGGRLALPGMAGGRFAERNFAIVDTVHAISRRLGASPSQVALTWLRQRSPAIVPIVGARTLLQLEDNLKCLAVELDPATMAELETVSAIDQGFPREFLYRGAVTKLLHGSDDRVADVRRI